MVIFLNQNKTVLLFQNVKVVPFQIRKSCYSRSKFNGCSPLQSIIIGVVVKLQPLSSILVSIFCDFQPGSICPRLAKDAQREPKGIQREPRGAQSLEKGSQMNNIEFTKTIFHEMYTKVIRPKRKKSFIQLCSNLNSGKSTLRILLATCCQQNHFVPQNPNIFPRSIRSVGYHYFGLSIQEIGSTENTNIL